MKASGSKFWPTFSLALAVCAVLSVFAAAAPPPSAAAPQWAFAGAYAIYSVTLGGKTSQVRIVIRAVSAGGRVQATIEAGGTRSSGLFSLGQSPFPQLNPNAPPGIGAAPDVRRSVSVSVPAGRFSVVQLSYPLLTGTARAWFDPQTGILVRLSGPVPFAMLVAPSVAAQGFVGSETVELVKTNLPLPPAKPAFLLYGGIGAGLFLLLALFTLFLARSRVRRAALSAAAAAATRTPAIAQIAKLKTMLDAGAITPADFQAAKGRLLAAAPEAASAPSPNGSRGYYLAASALAALAVAAIGAGVFLNSRPAGSAFSAVRSAVRKAPTVATSQFPTKQAAPAATQGVVQPPAGAAVPYPTRAGFSTGGPRAVAARRPRAAPAAPVVPASPRRSIEARARRPAQSPPPSPTPPVTPPSLPPPPAPATPPSLTLFPPQVRGLTAIISGVYRPTSPGATLSAPPRIDFGDGSSTAEDLPAAHRYQPGSYTVSVTVTDSNGMSVTRQIALTLVAAPLVVPAGTLIHAVLDGALSTKTSRPGDSFSATVTVPVLVAGKAAIAAGSKITGTVMQAKRGGLFGGRGLLQLRYDTIQAGGRQVVLHATLAAAGTQVVGQAEGTVTSSGASTARDTAVAAGGGAAIGAVLGGGKGAASGGAAGAIGGLALGMLAAHRDVTMPTGYAIELRLDGPITVARVRQ